MAKQIKINRCAETGDVSRETWKELISALALAGYEVYADEENIVFKLGDGDECSDVIP